MASHIILSHTGVFKRGFPPYNVGIIKVFLLGATQDLTYAVQG